MSESDFFASASHVHKGQLLEKSGKLQEALTEFEQAIAIDPSSFIAQQEANKVRRAMKEAEQPSQPTPNEAAQSALHKRMEEAGGPVELAPIANTPITLKLSEDTKTIYETIGKLAGINVLFDPDYTSRRIRVELNGVTLQEALEITALESKTFWRPVTPNTIFVAADTPAKRKEIEQSVIRTFYLSNLSQPNELQDLVNILTHAAGHAALAAVSFAAGHRGPRNARPDRAGRETDRRSRQVASGSRGRCRHHAGAAQQAAQSGHHSTDECVGRAAGQHQHDDVHFGFERGHRQRHRLPQTTGSTTGTINLNSLAHLNATNFQVTIPPATATFLYNDSNTRILQQPQIRALDGQKASLKIGQRVPVATGSFQPGIGGVGINPLVNTQFNYIDVGVNIDVTPHVHGTDQVTLKLSMDISAVDSYQNIGGIQQPVIGQRKIEHEIRMREGEANIMGGILEETESKSINGIPGLASIPFFRYFFSTENKQRQDNELVFMLIPHIVRAQDVFDSNTRAIDVGTANSISLHRSSCSGGGAASNSAGQTGDVGSPAGGQSSGRPGGNAPLRAAHW